MKIVLDLSRYWPRGVSINGVYEELIRLDQKVDRKTLTAAKKGKLYKSDFGTLVNLQKLASRWAGKELSINELFREVREEEPKPPSRRKV